MYVIFSVQKKNHIFLLSSSFELCLYAGFIYLTGYHLYPPRNFGFYCLVSTKSSEKKKKKSSWKQLDSYKSCRNWWLSRINTSCQHENIPYYIPKMPYKRFGKREGIKRWKKGGVMSRVLINGPSQSPYLNTPM